MRPYGCAGDPPGEMTRRTTFPVGSADDLRAIGAGERAGDFYPRYGHPAARTFEARMAELEGADGAVSFTSGMAALHGTLAALLSGGDVLAAAHDLYGGTSALLVHDLPRFGIEVRRFDPFDPDATRAAFDGAAVALVETPTNPLCRIVDLAAVANIARAAGVTTVVDATFMPPPLQRPLGDGIDAVMHSATKFLGGHHDCMGGVVSSRHALLERIEAFRRRTGAILAPDSAWLLSRSLKTLELRARACADNAAALARFLEGKVERLFRAGALMTIEVADAARVYDRFETISRAVSLGGVETTALLPRFSSHAMISAEERARLGITDQMIRISVGLEPVEELQADLEQALIAKS